MSKEEVSHFERIYVCPNQIDSRSLAAIEEQYLVSYNNCLTWVPAIGSGKLRSTSEENGFRLNSSRDILDF